MATEIHPTATVEKGAELDTSVRVGAYAYIGAQVQVASGTEIMHHSTVDGKTTLGKDNEIHPYAYIGGKTQDLKYRGGTQALQIGDRNVFREFTTVHCATADDLLTELGNDNLILAYSHIAHECKVGNHLIMSSHSALGGHVVLGDHVNVGWGTGVHQHCRVGDYAMIGASSLAVQDIPPFLIANGSPAKSRTVNAVGLERAGFTVEQISALRKTYRYFFKKDMNRSQARACLSETDLLEFPEVQKFCDFIDQSSRGIA